MTPSAHAIVKTENSIVSGIINSDVMNNVNDGENPPATTDPQYVRYHLQQYRWVLIFTKSVNFIRNKIEEICEKYILNYVLLHKNFNPYLIFKPLISRELFSCSAIRLVDNEI